MKLLSVATLLSLGLAAACTPSDDTDGGTSPGDAAVPLPDASVPRDAGVVPPVDAGSRPDAAAPCNHGSQPSDCSAVGSFQCGFMARCEDGTISVQWHEHMMCNGHDDIQGYGCSYTCPSGCVEGEIAAWPQSGTELVTEFCLGADAGAPVDAGPPEDAGQPDAAAEPDAGTPPVDGGYEPPECDVDCASISSFECGFFGYCHDGELYAEWHTHDFPPDGGVESINGHCCSHACAGGCTEGAIMDWPQSGSAFISGSCSP